MFSLNSMRSIFHNTWLGKGILGGVGLAMIVLAINGIGQNLRNRSSDTTPTAATVSNVVATVNGIPVTRNQYENQVNQLKQQAQMYGQTINPLTMGDIRMRALTQSLNAVETVQAAKNAGITVSDDEIANERSKQLVGLKQQLSLPASASESDVDSALAKYGQTVDNLIPTDDIRDELITQKYDDMIKASNIPTQDQVLAYYRDVHTRHILISNKTRPDAQAQLLAQNIIKQLQGGADFGKLVQQYSDDTASKPKGGDDGVVNGQTGYVSEFMNVADQLKPGQITPQPVLAPEFGYFVIQCLSSNENLPKDFAKNKASYTEQVADAMQKNVQSAALSAIAATAAVKINDPLLAGYRALSMPTPGQSQTVALQGAIGSFNQALNTASYDEKPEIFAMLAVAYRQLHDTKDELASLNSSIQAQDDPTVRLALGKEYLANGDKADALTQYAAASKIAYTDPNIHSDLASEYKKMGETQLANSEQTWLAKYAQTQKQANAVPGLPPGVKLN